MIIRGFCPLLVRTIYQTLPAFLFFLILVFLFLTFPFLLVTTFGHNLTTLDYKQLDLQYVHLMFLLHCDNYQIVQLCLYFYSRVHAEKITHIYLKCVIPFMFAFIFLTSQRDYIINTNAIYFTN